MRVMLSVLVVSPTSRWWWMRSSTSPQMTMSCSRKLSRVWLTAPSVEFSTGTTPKFTAPAATSRKTSSIAAIGALITAWPKCLSAAAWVKVPSGPR
ncbi:hypothetical protein D9M68_957830 [compost metagenome]